MIARALRLALLVLIVAGPRAAHAQEPGVKLAIGDVGLGIGDLQDRGGRGVSVSAFNDIHGRQHGLAIGLLNIADELHGLQVGLLNIARNKSSFSVLPLVNYNR